MVQNHLNCDQDTHNSSTHDTMNHEETFPVKLFNVLEFIRLQDPDLATIISWEPHGKGFQVHDPKKAEVEILPSFFNLRRYSSFHRQLNLWGFTRLAGSKKQEGGRHCIEEENKNVSSNDGSFYYYHEMFHRSKAFLCHSIRRRLRLPSFNLTSTMERKQPEYHSRMAFHHVPSSTSNSTAPAVAKKDQEKGDHDYGLITASCTLTSSRSEEPSVFSAFLEDTTHDSSSHIHPRFLESSTLAYLESNIVHSNAMGSSSNRRESVPSLLFGRWSLPENL